MKQYRIDIEGLSPLLQHQDNLGFAEKIKQWQKDPANKQHSTAGDDRSPAWTWIGSVYHDGRHVGIPADNIMTLLREGGAKVLTGKSKETYKRATQSGIMIDQQQFDLIVNGSKIKVDWMQELIGNLEFHEHIDAAEAHGFELLIKRARVGQAKHVRVRPMFRTWSASGTITVLDEEISGLTKGVLETIVTQAGSLCGVGDWRPSSPRSSGTFGRFAATVTPV